MHYGASEEYTIMKKIYLLPLIFLLSACTVLRFVSPDSEQMTMSTLWYQHSAEMRALYYQSFNLAEYRVQQALQNPDSEKPPAVVVDIDETILDNSHSEAKNILEGESLIRSRNYFVGGG